MKQRAAEVAAAAAQSKLAKQCVEKLCELQQEYEQKFYAMHNKLEEAREQHRDIVWIDEVMFTTRT